MKKNKKKGLELSKKDEVLLKALVDKFEKAEELRKKKEALELSKMKKSMLDI